MSISVTLPDGSTLDIAEGATVEDVAYAIGPGLGRDTVAGKVNGELVAREEPLTEDVTIEIVTADSEEYLDALRHTAAHVLAQAVKRHYPTAKLAIGPWTDDGFYYDIANVDFDAGDLDVLEAEAQEIIAEGFEITRSERSHDEALTHYTDVEPNRYKREILQEEAAGETTVSFYEQGEFQDLCRGPHVESTAEIGGFTLLEISAAYWRGNEDDDTLTRVYGTAFPTEEALDEYLSRRAAAKERDHRRLGKEMDLFSIPSHSPGCVHFHPRGMVIRRELETYVRQQNDELGYNEVWTPELNRTELWEASGHLDFFGEEGEFFLWEQDGEEYGLKPMNCANHAYLYDRKKRSYRELPLRFSEFGTVYRNEQSGELSGLLRVRGMTQDDGHAFVRPEQIQSEIANALEVMERIYKEFGLEAVYKLETRGDHAVGSVDIWERATDALRDALDECELSYTVEEGEAAFYGPKIGLDARDALGREWTVGTVQLDFNIPARLDLTYIGEDNESHRPVLIHRALLGTFERFLGVMLEHFGGDFPPWLAPEQVRILPISDDQLDYARSVEQALGDVRTTIEDRSWTLGRKIQTAHDDRIPYMLIVGENEAADTTVSVRDRFEEEAGPIPVDAFVTAIQNEIEQKRITPSVIDEVHDAE